MTTQPQPSLAAIRAKIAEAAALAALRREHPEADHHALAQTAVRAIRPALMRGLEADNLLREVLAHADGTFSPPGGLAEIADHIRTHLAAG